MTANLQPHPLANILPRMKKDEFDLLVASIRDVGQQVPIIVDGDGRIIDGVNRWLACQRLGREVEIDKARYEGEDPLSYILSVNLRRRHLNESQRARVAAKLVTTKLGDNQHSREGRSIDLLTAAEMLNVSEKSVKRARGLLERGAPEVQEAVENGQVRLGAIEPLLDKPREEQGPALSAIINAKHKPAAPAKPKGKKTDTEANPEIIAIDEFKKKWLGFNDTQRRAFVVAFKDTLVKLIAEENTRSAMISTAA